MLDSLRHEQIEVLTETDIIIVGAGSAGCCAALAARERGGHDVVLIERYGFLGGTSTQVLDTFYGFFTPGREPRKVVGGIPDRVVDALDDASAMFLRPNTYGAGTGVTYDPERLKLVWDRLLERAGVRVLLHALLVDTETASDGRIMSIVLSTKRGFYRIRAKRFIDASGDADLCHWAGVPYERAGDMEPAQTLTTTFRMCNVDLGRFEEAGGKRMLGERMALAVEQARHALPRKKGSAHAMVQPGCISTVAVRVADVDGTDFRQLTDAEREGRRQAYVYEAFFRDCVPGYENARIIGLSTQIGVRESRRVYGEYRLSRDDCLNARQFHDRVLLCGAPIEDHRKGGAGQGETEWVYVAEGRAYDVPYRTLVPSARDELWVAGRCFSATHDAHASCRSMGQTMAMGQATGLAAALSLELDCGARDVPLARLQDRLIELGAVLDLPANIADTAALAWRRNRRQSTADDRHAFASPKIERRRPTINDQQSAADHSTPLPVPPRWAEESGQSSDVSPDAPAVVRTVLGDVAAVELGVCYAHEHVIIERSYTTERTPDFLLDSVEAASSELEELRAAGVRAVVDSMPADCGRSVCKLAEVARRTGMHIVCPTGVHLAKYYPHGHWSERLDAEHLADLFEADIERGIDANDYGGPTVRRTEHRAGVIKVAGGLDRLSSHERKIFEAAAIAHARTSAPILTHTEQGTAALEQIDLLEKWGVPPHHVVLSHTDRRPDFDYHKEIASAGAFVELDSAFRWRPEQGNPTLDLVARLFESGHGDHVLLGMDAARRGYWRSYGGGPGLTFLIRVFVPRLIAAGLRQEDVDRIFIGNPARAFRFRAARLVTERARPLVRATAPAS